MFCNCRDFPRPKDTLQWTVFMLETWLCRGSVATGRIDHVCMAFLEKYVWYIIRGIHCHSVCTWNEWQICRQHCKTFSSATDFKVIHYADKRFHVCTIQTMLDDPEICVDCLLQPGFRSSLVCTGRSVTKGGTMKNTGKTSSFIFWTGCEGLKEIWLPF